MLLINPGAGPIRGLRLSMRSAQASLRAFLSLMPEGTHAWPAQSIDDSGRISVTLTRGKRKCEVDIPACALKHLRSPSGFPPRLYVDGSSWMWKYAAEIAQEELGG